MGRAFSREYLYLVIKVFLANIIFYKIPFALFRLINHNERVIFGYSTKYCALNLVLRVASYVHTYNCLMRFRVSCV